MSRFLRLMMAVLVLMVASLTGCLLSAAQMVPMQAGRYDDAVSITQHVPFGNVVMMFGGIALAMVSLAVYAVRLRRSAARLQLDHAADQLLIDALDRMRAAIVIFDADMKVVHWNSGFERQFPTLLPLLQDAATLGQTLVFAHRKGVFISDGMSGAIESFANIENFANITVQKLRNRQTVQQTVHAPTGSTFDMGIFPLGDRHYGAMWIDVSNAHRQQERITAQSRELEQKNQQLLAFATIVAHDLRAPLMQQSAVIEFMREDIGAVGLDLPCNVERHITLLADLSCRMTALVGDLLDYAQADSDQAPPECFRPDTRMEGALELAGTGAHIKLVIMPDMPAVRVEPNAFNMVIRNLVTNAVKHHDKPSGCITLRAYRMPGHVMIEVEDDGPGIPFAHRDRVFEPFARLSHVQGTGLGLALVKKTVLAWGGAIHLRAAPERGCIFCVSVPAAPVEARGSSLPLGIEPKAFQD